MTVTKRRVDNGSSLTEPTPPRDEGPRCHFVDREGLALCLADLSGQPRHSVRQGVLDGVQVRCGSLDGPCGECGLPRCSVCVELFELLAGGV